MKSILARMLVYILPLIICACDGKPLNDPYPKSETEKNILYSSFSERPKTLDPAKAYSSNEYTFIAQIYEPPLQYHYLERPFKLIPLAAEEVPKPQYLNENGMILNGNAETNKIAYTRYVIGVKPNRYYQPHPALAKNKDGIYYYHNLNEDYLDDNDIRILNDFKHKGTRELTAADYVYQIKRLADPQVQSPILGLMSEYILGLNKLAKDISDNKGLDLRNYNLEGANVIDRYTYEIKIKGKYPQFIYWLAMPFFAPMPWEADIFYSQPDMQDRNISLDWYPIGTAAYQLTENNPNRRMVLDKNPNFAGEKYPENGSEKDKLQGLLADAGKQLPMIDKVIFILEKETIPRWSKFLQGYYDNSGISSDSFDQAIQMDEQGEANLSPTMQKRGIRLYSSVSPSIYYMGFNMLDDVVGGYSDKARKLRQAISIALDYEEYISIFLNGRGIVAQGPIPPGIFGFVEGEKGINTSIYKWVDDAAKRKSIASAKKLLADAGYPNGRSAKTGKPLILNYDVPISSGPDDKARFSWMRKQFAKLGIQLNIRATQYNRFQEKMRNGSAQIFTWGWNADYPDPENFLFLLYGPNSKVKHNGENAANYANPKYDRLFNKMKNLNNGPERQLIIDQMIKILHNDSPWIWGFFPKNFTLSHKWNRISKPSQIANNTLKYASLDPKMRAEKRQEWNKPVLWPLLAFLVAIVLVCIPVLINYWLKEYRTRK